MTGTEFIERYPRLYYMATAGALPQIKKYGLLSSEATLDLLSINGTRREQLLACRRPESVILESPEHERFVLRDQKPMRDAALAECLVGMTLPEWYRLLNGRTFMWSNKDRVETLLGARAYRGAEHLILTVDTASFARKYESQLELSPINSGATLYIPPKRGAFTFTRLSEYENTNGNRPVVETTVRYSIPDIKDFIVGSETRKAF